MLNPGPEDSRDETLDQLKALGYIDPGAGSSIWQLVLARLFGISSKVKSLFRKQESSED